MYRASGSPSCEVCTCSRLRKKNGNQKRIIFDHLLTLKISRYVVFLDGNMYRKQKEEKEKMMTGRYIAMVWIIDGFSLRLKCYLFALNVWI